MGKLKAIKIFSVFFLVFFLCIYLGSKYPIWLFFKLNENHFSKDIFEIRSAFYIKQSKSRSRDWILRGYLLHAKKEVSFTAADFGSVRGLNTSTELQSSYPAGTTFPVFHMPGEWMTISRRNPGLVSQHLIDTTSVREVAIVTSLTLLPLIVWVAASLKEWATRKNNSK